MSEIKPRITVEYADKATIVKFTQERILDEAQIKGIQDSIMSVVDQGEGINLVLDFENVKFMSSAGLGLLLRISRRVYEHNGQLRLCSIGEKIYEIFRITRLTKIFEIYDDLDSALTDFPADG